MQVQVSDSEEATYGTYLKYTDDYGRTWERRPRAGRIVVLEDPYETGERGFWEMGMVEYTPGRLLAHGRTVTGWLYESRSDDFGTTWSAPMRLDIPHTKSPPVLSKTPGTDLVLRIWNSYVEQPKKHWHFGKRVILASQVSSDSGRTWRGYREIE